MIAQLIDTSDGSHIWSQTYDRTLDDIFKIHDEIAQSVVSALRVTLLQEEEARLVRHSTDNVRAHELYLAALSLYYAATYEDVLRSLELLEQAVEEDAGYSDAWAQMGLGYSALAFRSSSPDTFRDYVNKGNEAAQQALQLDPDSSLAYTAKGELQRRSGNVEEALINLQKAIELSPNNARAWQLAGLALLDQPGKVEQALDYQLRSRELNTQSRYLLRQISYSYNAMGRYDEELETLQEGLQLHPQAPLYYSDMGRYHLGVVGRPDIALRWFGDGIRIDPTHIDAGVPIASQLLVAYAMAGDLENANRWLARLEQDAAGSNSASAFRIFLANWAGDHASAAELAEEFVSNPVRSQLQNYESPMLSAADAFVLNGQYDRAIESYISTMPEYANPESYGDAFERSFFASRVALNLARALMLAGREAESTQLIETLENAPELLKRDGPFTWYNTYSISYLQAELHALRGEDEQALNALEQMLEFPNDGYVAIGVLPVPIADSPYFDAIRETARFQLFAEEIRRRKGVARQRIAALDLPEP